MYIILLEMRYIINIKNFMLKHVGNDTGKDKILAFVPTVITLPKTASLFVRERATRDLM